MFFSQDSDDFVEQTKKYWLEHFLNAGKEATDKWLEMRQSYLNSLPFYARVGQRLVEEFFYGWVIVEAAEEASEEFRSGRYYERPPDIRSQLVLHENAARSIA